ncbi:MAG: acetyl-CoA carboxylase biotin carboxylase subunit [candidate division WOR-3 bacterium]
MFKKILIANRGEIALRIIRACKELGIKTVVVYSEADRESLPVKLADEKVCIGAAPAQDSYLNIPRILSAAEVTGSEAIHPGYGFLAESAEFAEACESCNFKFIGPSAEIIRLMGDKVQARQKMRQAGVPVLEGSDGEINSVKEAKAIAAEVGYPVIFKAVAGGGGKGMRVVRSEKDIETGLRMSQAEAKATFGDARVYLEKFLERTRHIEVQILGDKQGRIIHLGERECSIQRRHQKLIEECPSPMVDEILRQKLGDWAVRGAQAINYHNAGTIEFLADEKKNFYFLEMNTRIQVEHPVTELVTRTDIVKAQILLAGGENLCTALGGIDKSFIFEELKEIHALECRINAEDPGQDFMPIPGKITNLHLPGGAGVRVDSHIYPGYTIPPYYDSLIAKIIVWDTNRAGAIARMERALTETLIEGVKTTIPFHLKILANKKFRAGEISTALIESLSTESI